MASTQRILTTHVGSLPRPKDLLDLMKAKITGQHYEGAALDAKVSDAVAECGQLYEVLRDVGLRPVDAIHVETWFAAVGRP